jgi:Delta7-sterol 5-desaturase
MLTDTQLRQFGSDAFRAAMADVLGYVLAAGAAWLLFYVAFKAAFRHRRIAQREPTARQISREVLYSLRTLAIFGLVTGAVIYAAYLGWTKLYLRVDTYGWGWFVLSVAVMVVVHDAYFYWTHRLMHHRWLFRWVHQAHHRSTSPTPWAAYSFSVPEAFVQAAIGPLLVFTIPIHSGALRRDGIAGQSPQGLELRRGGAHPSCPQRPSPPQLM